MKRNPMLARIEAAAEARYQKRLHASMGNAPPDGPGRRYDCRPRCPQAWARAC